MNKTVFTVIIVVAVLGLSAVVFFVASDNDSDIANTATANTNTPAPDTNVNNNTAIYTIAQVAEHDSATDCWMVIQGKVYDVTEFISRHPGGSVIIRGCGIDATGLFESRPTDNSPHSLRARDIASQYQIGVIGR